MLKTVTLSQLARKARVSISTASRVMNGDLAVQESTRDRVLKAAQTLNYSPNLLAKSLRAGKSFTIGLVIDNISNPFFAEITNGIEHVAQQNGYNLFLCNSHLDDKKTMQYLDILLGRGVDGVIFSGLGTDVASLAMRIDRLRREEIFTVLVSSRWPIDRCSSITVDHSKASRLAVDYLVSLGHTQLGFMHGRKNTVVNEERFAGFQQGLLEAGLTPQLRWCSEGGFDYDQAKQAMRNLVRAGDLPTGLVVANDLMALGVLEVAREVNLSIPEDLSVIGCDDIAFAAQSYPALTTVRLPQYQLGEAAMQELLRLFSSKGEEGYQHVVMDVRLIKRGSAGPIPKERID